MDQYHDYVDDAIGGNMSEGDSGESDRKFGLEEDSDDYISIAERLVKAFFDYEDFVGSTYYKQVRLYKYHNILVEALKDPSKLIYPST